MRSAQGPQFWAVLFPGLCRGAPAQTIPVLDIKDATWFFTLGLLQGAHLYRFLMIFSAFATATPELLQIGGV